MEKRRRTPKEACAEFDADMKPKFKDQYDHMHYVVMFRDATSGQQVITTTAQTPREAVRFLEEAIRQLRAAEADEPLIIPAGLVPLA